jgi:hypothetical protein
MKASDSVNSLTELNKSQDQNTCFICLEEDTLGNVLVSSQILRNCGCRFFVHTSCWNEWIKNKTDYDCPICHKSSMLKIHIPPNPVLVFEYQPPQNTTKRRLLFILVGIFILIAVGILIERIMHDH